MQFLDKSMQIVYNVINFPFQLLFPLPRETLPKNLLSYLEAVGEYGEKSGL